MAYVKIRVIRCSSSHLQAAISYSANYAKTAPAAEKEDAASRLAAAQEYVLREEKIHLGEERFASAIHCSCIENAMREFLATKRRFGKEDGRLGYQIIQSFAPEENIPPELAHEIGCAFIRELLPGHEAVVGTHLDRAHIHNHIIVNSVSLADGSKAHFPKGWIDKVMRNVSDRLCREHGLSVISRGETAAKKLPAELRHFPAGTFRETMNRDIRWAASRSEDQVEILLRLQELGYETDGSGFHVKVRPPGGERFFRLDTYYTEEEILELCRGGKSAPAQMGALRLRSADRRFRDEAQPTHALQTLYLQISVLLGRQERDRKSYIPFACYQKIRETEKDLQFLAKHDIRSAEDMRAFHTALAEERKQLDGSRYRLNKKKRESAPLFEAQMRAADLGSRKERTAEEETLLQEAEAVLAAAGLTGKEAKARRELLERLLFETGQDRKKVTQELKTATRIMETEPAFREILAEYRKEKEERRLAFAARREEKPELYPAVRESVQVEGPRTEKRNAREKGERDGR